MELDVSDWNSRAPRLNLCYLDPRKGFYDPDEVLLQQVVIQLGQMGADDGVIPQLSFVLR